MLKYLYIENITIIKKVYIDFKQGLNVIVGQTGSGKSVILDAIDLVIGGRAKAEMVRSGEQKAVVIAEFENCNNPELLDILLQNSISLSDETISLKRVINSDGKSSAFIGDMPVTLALINKISGYLIEINGQFVQGRLLEATEHLKMLDEYAGLRDNLVVLQLLFFAYTDSVREYKKILEIKEKIAQDYEYYVATVKDIENLHFVENEENKLLERKKQLVEQGSSLKTLEEIISLEQQNNLIKTVKKIAKNVTIAKSGSGDEFSGIATAIEQAAIELCEGLDYIWNLVKKTGNTETELENIEERLYQIRQVCRKYNLNSAGLFELLEKAKQSIYATDNVDINLVNADKKVKETWQHYQVSAKQISQKRSQASLEFVKELHTELATLKMEHAKMEVVITEDEKIATSHGINTVHFAASTNPGMPIMPIHKIASGGELSRFMLAFKAVMSRKVSLPAIIFDEIDSGTSGIVASVIAEYLSNLSKQTQVLAVTHSHQVVKRGNAVFRISKKTDGIETSVQIDHLDEIGVTKEIEVMISGVEI